MEEKTKAYLRSYTMWSKNRTEKGGGGVATAVAHEFRDSTIGAGEGEDDDEYLVTRIESFNPALNVINCYGEQRTLKNDTVEAKWGRLLNDMEAINEQEMSCVCWWGTLTS